jgi:hypothetical protein
MMTFKQVLSYAGGAAVSLMLLPIFAVGSFVVLMGYAACSEAGDILLVLRGKARTPADTREMARRLCVGQ